MICCFLEIQTQTVQSGKHVTRCISNFTASSSCIVYKITITGL